MSYGFKFLNDSNQVIIDDVNVKPWFWGQATVDYIDSTTSGLDVLNNFSYITAPPSTSFRPPDAPGVTQWTLYTLRYIVSAHHNCFGCLELPNTTNPIYYRITKNHRLIGEPNYMYVNAYVPNTVVPTAADVPRLYIFVADPVPLPNLSTGYGVHVFNASGQCMYDSNKKHFQPRSLNNIYIVNPRDHVFQSGEAVPGGDTYNLNLPTNAAFLLPTATPIYAYIGTNEIREVTYHAIFRRVGDILRIGMPGISDYPSLSNNITGPGFYNTSGLGNQNIIVIDTATLNEGYTPPNFPPSYRLSIGTIAIEEGYLNENNLYRRNVTTVTLNTAGVANGTLVPYIITGIQGTDIDVPLNGNFVISGNQATLTIQALRDGVVESLETATVALGNGLSSSTVNFTISEAVSYSLSSFMTPEEGQSIAVTLTTEGLANGSIVPYTTTGITQADLTVGTTSGNFTISNNTSTLEFRFARDSVTESETMRIFVNANQTSLSIPITDVPAGNEVLTLSPSTFNYNDRISLTITGGTPNGSFEFQNLPQGVDPVYAWNNRWKPEYSTVGTAYFDENGNFSNPPYTALGPTGSDLGGDPNATVNRTFWIFTTTTKNFRSFNYTIIPEPAFFVSGTDNTQGPLYVDEGTTGYFKVTTANIPNGTVVYPKLIGGTLSANDFTNTGANGITIQNNVATFQITFTADQMLDGATESAELVVQYPNGTTKNSYGNIFVSDTSLPAASYSLTKAIPSGDTANEGTTAYFYLTTNQSANLYWVLEGTGITNDDIDYAGAYDADGNYYSYGPDRSGIISSTYYMLTIQFKNDVRTEGNETLVVNIKTGSTTGQVVASASVIIGDTSVYPTVGTPAGDPYCIGTTRYQNYHNGSGGQYSSVIAYNSVLCGYVPPASYSVSRYVATVNENGFQFFTIGLTSVPAGTQLWWDISGTNITTNDIQYVYHDAQDGEGWFTPSGGSTLNNTFTVYSQTSYQVIIYPRSDLQTEGTETATFNLRTGYSGGPSVANISFDIGDTSTTPSYNESVTIVSDANSNYIVPLNGYMTISVTGGMPFGSFSYESTNNGDAQPTTFTGTGLTLDGSGNFTNYITGATARGSQTVGDFRLWFKFNYNNNVRSARYQTVYDAGTTSGGQYCVGYTLTQNYNNGTGGTYSQVVEYNNVVPCGYTVQYTPTRTAVTYNYYNYDYQGDTWGMDGGRPFGAVTATIVTGPYTGFALSGSFNGSGQYRQVVGNYGALAVGFYTINFTFPGQDAYYPSNYRTIVAYFYVQNASAGEGGVIP
jgi:hypothetical protein